jgi:RNA polymerase sigma-70 factor (ECF subfamily)
MPHLRQLYSTAWRLTRNSADAEDLVQETDLRAYRGFGGYAVGTNIRGWLLTILHRAFTDSLRKRGRSPKLVELVDEGPAAVPPNHALHGEDQRVARALERVPEVYRTAVVLRDVQDFSYDEISRTLGVPIGTVMSRIHRGRGLLRSMLSS